MRVRGDRKHTLQDLRLHSRKEPLFCLLSSAPMAEDTASPSGESSALLGPEFRAMLKSSIREVLQETLHSIETVLPRGAVSWHSRHARLLLWQYIPMLGVCMRVYPCVGLDL